ncbi:MAG: hypothetical protein M3069_14935, partial [Chloroflexota bacterium]|nr:hypothetical protein [Chloroflexota bacterium]
PAAFAREIRDPVALKAPLNDDRIEGLRPWLEILRRTVDQGTWPAARVGLDHWLDIVRISSLST